MHLSLAGLGAAELTFLLLNVVWPIPFPSEHWKLGVAVPQFVVGVQNSSGTGPEPKFTLSFVNIFRRKQFIL